jgi:succinate-acetate transporter protein
MAANGAANGHAVDQEKQTISANNASGEYGRGAQLNRVATPGGHPLDSSQPSFPVYHRKFANPAPLGLMAFALTTFVLSLINVKARGLAQSNNSIIIGLAFGYGGLVQLLAGMWEFAAGNTFGATAFCSYGGFWISFAFILWPGAEIETRTAAASTADLLNAIGLYLSGWFIFTFLMLIASLRSSVALVSVFFFLTITFLLLFIGFFLEANGSTNASMVTTAGGSFGLVTAACAWYTAMTGLLSPESAFFVLPSISLNKRE